MSRRPAYVILGAGVAGHFAADALRQAGFDGQVLLIGAEPVRPYDRPALSKGILQGTKEPQAIIFQPEAFYREREIDLVLGRAAVEIDPAARRVVLDSGKSVSYDRLLIATGAAPIRPRLPGIGLPGVHVLRSLADAEALRAGLLAAERVLVIGAGFVGSEVAASARTLGRDVTLLDLLPAPMSRALGPELAAVYAELHRAHGVDLRMGRGVVELRGRDRVEEAVLDDGTLLACDLVVLGVGVRPAVDLAMAAGLDVDDGILVDEHCATNASGVYAAGDVATWWHPTLGRRIRVEHFDNAGEQGAAAGRAMAGQPEPYAPVPSFWTDQYDTTLQYYGYPVPWDQVVLRGDAAAFSVTAFYLAEGRIVAAAMLNRPKEHRSARRLVAAGAAVDPAVLADPDTDLRALSRQFAAG